MTGLIKISVWHNVTRGEAGRHTGPSGFTPGDQMVKVFTCHTAPGGRSPEAIAEAAWAAFNGAPHNDQDADLARRYFQRGLRQLAAGDMVAVGEIPLIAASIGFIPLPGPFTPVHASEPGTHPIG